MSIQWTLVAGFLYIEVAVVLLLLLPFISARRWHSLFRSRFLKALEGQSMFYFYVLLLMLVLLFLDALREMRKFSDELGDKDHQHGHLDLEIQNHMRLFRAQRNFYISGFALFLSLVLRRLTSLISRQALLEAGSEAAMRQALSASNAAQRLMSSGGGSALSEKEVDELRASITALEKERDSALKKCEAMQMQAESTSREYDRLCEEHSKLEKQLRISDKKDD